MVTGHCELFGRKTSKAFASDFTMHITVEDRLIVAYRMYEDSHALAESFSRD